MESDQWQKKGDDPAVQYETLYLHLVTLYKDDISRFFYDFFYQPFYVEIILKAISADRCSSNRAEHEDSSHQDELQQDQDCRCFFSGRIIQGTVSLD
jgi:hypothetical protein